MKSKWHLFGAIFDIIVGVAGILAFIIILASGDSVGRWIPALILSVCFLGLGIYEIRNWNRK